MRVLSFSVLFGLSEVGKAQNNDEWIRLQFPGGVPEFDADEPPPIMSEAARSSWMADLLGRKHIGKGLNLAHGAAMEYCSARGMQLAVPKSASDVELLNELHTLGETSGGCFYIGLRRKVDDKNAAFYNVYTGEHANVEDFVTDRSDTHRCGEICKWSKRGIADWICGDGADTIGGGMYDTVCVPGGEGPDVSCMNEHWTYNEDTEQCEPDADLSSIECGSTGMTISIHKAFVYKEYDGDVPSTITIGNKNCTATWDADKMAVFKVDFNDECGQHIHHEDGTISISIDLVRPGTKEVDGVTIFTSKEDNMIWTFTCSYDDVISTNTSLEVSGSKDDLFGATSLHTEFPADDFPIKIVNVESPGDPIKTGCLASLAIQIPEGFPKNLKLHFATCTATADGDESITINMVKDGCALDAVDSADASTSENAISYTYKAFAFPGFELMHISCDAKICLDTEVREDCMEMEDTCAEGFTDIFKED